jgi:type I restriction enzyme S subunit
MTLKVIRIGELGRIVTGDTPLKSRSEFYGSAYPFIKPTDMKVGQRFTFAYDECYSEEAFEKYRKKLIPTGSTAVVTIGSIGQKLTLTHTPCFVNQAVNAVVPDPLRFDSVYVYYLLRHNLQLVKSADTGASSGRENVSKSNFSGIELLACLDLDEQKRIAKVLNSYDSLIEINQKRVALLEDTARLLYREWFCGCEVTADSRPGWKRTTLDAICDLIKDQADPGKVAPNTPYLSMEHMHPKSISLAEWETAGKVSSLKLRFKSGDVLFGRIRAYFHKVGIAQISGITSTDMLVVRAKSEDLLPLVALIMSSDEFVAHAVVTSNGTKMPRADWKVLKSWELLIPAPSEISEFAAKVLPIFRLLEVLSSQNRQLTQVRDALLPNLMSGEIQV